MPLNPGNNTVTFISEAWTGTPDRLGITGPVPTDFTQAGCAMQPVTGGDKITDTNYSDATFRCIAPTTDVTTAAKADDFIEFLGVKYRILFVKPYYDDWARLTHITFMCKEDTG